MGRRSRRYRATSTDVERGNTDDDSLDDNPFSDKRLRNAFIQKVYGILACQLALTFAISGIFLL